MLVNVYYCIIQTSCSYLIITSLAMTSQQLETKEVWECEFVDGLTGQHNIYEQYKTVIEQGMIVSKREGWNIT